MRSLTVRIFLSFWLIIAILIGVAAVAGFSYAERLRQAFENFEVDDTVIAASAALNADGRTGLEVWARDLPGTSPVDVYVVDQSGQEILGRKLPSQVARMIRRLDSRRGNRRGRPSRNRDDSASIRPARPLTQIVGPDGETFRLVVSPKRNPYGKWIAERAGPAFLFIALLISAGVSFALARAIARPVQTFREATVSIANGRLDTRIAASMRNRRDEIGMLAHDLDAMADKLQDASTQQTELTRNISHELRSPLARLRVALELARRQAGDLPEFARIDRETERLDDLIGQILSYSRMEAGSDEPREVVDVTELLQEAVENANFECNASGREGISVALNANDDLRVNGYRTALASAIENVLRNAVRHSPNNGVVTVQASQEGNSLNIEIEDAGQGVPTDALEDIFDPFFRAPQAEGAKPAGTGLGLAIARRAIEKNVGRISAHSAERGGLLIRICLPAATQVG
jgi:two-component system sensor histidine kinase CpxA